MQYAGAFIAPCLDSVEQGIAVPVTHLVLALLRASGQLARTAICGLSQSLPTQQPACHVNLPTY